MGRAVDVTLCIGRQASCRVVIESGSIHRCGAIFTHDAQRRHAVWFADPTVRSVVGEAVESTLSKHYERVDSVVMEIGERAKSLDSFGRMLEDLQQCGADRNTTLVAVGGGSVTDAVGFLAASYMRGISYVSIPTTITAQVDAAVGGKVGLNLPGGKNLLGAFHHPRAVVVDPKLLSGPRHPAYWDGIAEVLKVAIIADAELFDLMELGPEAVLNDSARTEKMVSAALFAKINLLLPDPFETNLDRLLNFGHEIAHGLETTTGHAIRHGQAVGIGIATSARLAQTRGILPSGDLRRIEAVLAGYGLRAHQELGAQEREKFAEALNQVKLVRGGNLRVVLPNRIGSGLIMSDVDTYDLLAVVEAG